MFRVLVFVMWATVQAPAVAVLAQHDAGVAAVDAGPVRVDPRTGERYRLVRPEEGLRRGSVPVASWVVMTTGALVVAAAAALLVMRSLRRKL